MKLTTVSGKLAKFNVTDDVLVEAKRFLTMQFKRRITEGRTEKESSEMALLYLKYWVGETNESYFDGSDVASFMKEENDWMEKKLKI